ncbi:natural killer cell receptor 2B4 isoform X2 [Sylvia atricapilla]|uniref:natural killer cell receptor 2B4 isoform X2 n=1 Tax=Sylvia atricapilla TaxID=48155 RepID=UPI00339B402E
MAWRERNFWDGDGECPPGTLQVWAGGVTSSDRVPLGPVEPLLGSQPPPGSVLGVLGSLECRDRAVSAGSSLCLEPEKPPWEWTEIHWRAKKDPRTQERILTANRTGIVSRPKGSFQGRAEFRLEPLALCLSPVLRRDHGVYTAEFENSSGIFSRCFQVTVWDPIQEPSLKSQLLRRDPGWCLLSLLCSSPGNVSYTWTCPGDPVELSEFPEIPKFPEIPEFQSWIIRRVPEGAEPQNCRCNVSNPAGWRTASANLTCPGIPGNFSHWMLVTVALTLTLTLTLTLLLVGCCCWRRRRRKNSREGRSHHLRRGQSQDSGTSQELGKIPKFNPLFHGPVHSAAFLHPEEEAGPSFDLHRLLGGYRRLPEFGIPKTCRTPASLKSPKFPQE